MEMAKHNRSIDNDTASTHYYFEQTTDTYLFVPPNLFQFIKVFCILCYSIIFIVGILGNSLVIWIAGFKMRTVNALWFLDLAVADFICSAFLPVRITEWSLFTISYYPKELCLTSAFVLIFSMCSSVYFLTVISIDRCVSIVWPIWTRTHRTLKMARIVSIVVWAVCLILSAPIGASYYWYINFSDCAPKDLQISFTAFSHLVRSLRLIRFTFMFVLPFAFILICYGVFFYKLKPLMKRRSHQSYKMVIAVMVCFFICWFPYYTWPFIHIGQENYQFDNLINELFICLAYFNSCINPILYVFFSRDFKDNFFKSIPAMLEKAFSDKYQLCNGEEDVEMHFKSTSKIV